jgi:hypothetical protein
MVTKMRLYQYSIVMSFVLIIGGCTLKQPPAATTPQENSYNPAWTNPADYPSLRKSSNAVSQKLRDKTPAYKFYTPETEATEKQNDPATANKK